MPNELKIGFVPASRTIFDQDLAVKVRGAFLEAFSQAGLEAVAPDESLTKNGLVQDPVEAGKVGRMFREEKVAGVVVGALNFGNEIPAALAAVSGGAELPVMLFGVGEEGALTREAPRRDSFCGMISIATALRHREARFVFPRRAVGFPHEEGFVRALAEFGSVCRAVSGIRNAVYGQFGPRPADFETCAFDELSLLRKFGARVVPFPLTTLFARALAAPEKKIRETYSDMERSVHRSRVSDLDLARMARLEVALVETIEENSLDGIGLQCWTSIQDDYGVSPCFVMSRLTDRGIPCACEVDIHGTLSMHLLSLIADIPAGLADWNNRHFEETHAFSAWHCGVFPGSACSGAGSLGKHDILAQSTGSDEGKYGTIELEMDEGPVTMLRLTEHPLESWPMLVAEGDVVRLEGEPPGSHGWVRVTDLDALYAEVLRGFSHHTALTRGHVGGPALCAAYFLGLEPVVPLDIERGHLEPGPAY